MFNRKYTKCYCNYILGIPTDKKIIYHLYGCPRDNATQEFYKEPWYKRMMYYIKPYQAYDYYLRP